ncbi:MAG: nucleotidyltransferase family protein [Rectinemataceae bacterium]|nr:nucleotidyltransferase family protein [Rectinemataceae bacterium]
MTKERILSLSIAKDCTLINALKRMDETESKLLMVTDDGHLLGLLSIGDIQRGILARLAMDTPAGKILRKDFLYCSVDDSHQKIRALMLENRCEYMPLVGERFTLVDVMAWEELFGVRKPTNKRRAPVVIMAGGLGLRMKPLTNVIPKPLIPVGDRSILERIIANFADTGCDEFFLCVNYKAAMIEYYLSTVDLGGSVLKMVREDKPLGTAGALKLLEGQIKEPFYVTNCDILIDADYPELLAHHQKTGDTITIVSALKTMDIPYGVLYFSEGGVLDRIEEKPVQSISVNTGMYVVDPSVFDLIGNNESIGFPDLVDRVRSEGGRVGVFPVSEKSWYDIGNWDEYVATLRDSGRG